MVQPLVRKSRCVNNRSGRKIIGAARQRQGRRRKAGRSLIGTGQANPPQVRRIPNLTQRQVATTVDNDQCTGNMPDRRRQVVEHFARVEDTNRHYCSDPTRHSLNHGRGGEPFRQHPMRRFQAAAAASATNIAGSAARTAEVQRFWPIRRLSPKEITGPP